MRLHLRLRWAMSSRLTTADNNFVLDRLSHYEATLWRQAGQILALDALDRRIDTSPSMVDRPQLPTSESGDRYISGRRWRR